MPRPRPTVPTWKEILPRITDGDPEATSTLITTLALVLPKYVRNPPGYAQREDGVQVVLSSLIAGITAPADAGWEVGDRKFPWRDLNLTLPIDQQQPALVLWARDVADHLRNQHRQTKRLELKLIEANQEPNWDDIRHSTSVCVGDLGAYLALLNGTNKSEVKARFGVLKSLLRPWAKALEAEGNTDAESLPVSRLCRRIFQAQFHRHDKPLLRPDPAHLEEALAALRGGIHRLGIEAEKEAFEQLLREAIHPGSTMLGMVATLRGSARNETSFFVALWASAGLKELEINGIDILVQWDPAKASADPFVRQRMSEKASEHLLTVPALGIILSR